MKEQEKNVKRVMSRAVFFVNNVKNKAKRVTLFKRPIMMAPTTDRQFLEVFKKCLRHFPLLILNY